MREKAKTPNSRTGDADVAINGHEPSSNAGLVGKNLPSSPDRATQGHLDLQICETPNRRADGRFAEIGDGCAQLLGRVVSPGACVGRATRHG
jgi:hypothetical protein